MLHKICSSARVTLSDGLILRFVGFEPSHKFAVQVALHRNSAYQFSNEVLAIRNCFRADHYSRTRTFPHFLYLGKVNESLPSPNSTAVLGERLLRGTADAHRGEGELGHKGVPVATLDGLKSAWRDWKAGLTSVPCDIGIALEIPGDAARHRYFGPI